MANRIIDRLVNLDAYPKTLEDFRIKTFSGATVTLISGILMASLFVVELRDYLSVELTEELFVDTSRIPKMKIQFDVVFPTIACPYLSVDAVDSSGEQQTAIADNVFKRRLDLTGKPLDDPERDVVNRNQTVLASSAVSSTEANVICGTCYGAESAELKCCNTCADVRTAYRAKGWAFHPEGVEQCKNDKSLTNDGEAFKEGCQVYGTLEVNRVGGSFHIAPGKSYYVSHVHVHDVNPYNAEDFNLTHRIRHLAFGRSLQGKTNPIDGTYVVAEKGSMMFQYYIKIVPTTYVRNDGATLQTNQFSVTQHQKEVNMKTGESGLPGVFFSYELSPLMIRYSEKQKSIGHFLTDVCAIIGGIFTVAGIIDSFIYRSSKALKQKVELGKFT